MSTTEYLPLRLLPGQDLKEEIQQFCQKNQIKAGAIIAAVGSLSVAKLRLANAKNIKEIIGPFEILSLSGTLSLEGIHLHLAIADKDGTCLGGHLMAGCLIYTTAELVFIKMSDFEFKRSPDPKTGYNELQIVVSK